MDACLVLVSAEFQTKSRLLSGTFSVPAEVIQRDSSSCCCWRVYILSLIFKGGKAKPTSFFFQFPANILYPEQKWVPCAFLHSSKGLFVKSSHWWLWKGVISLEKCNAPVKWCLGGVGVCSGKVLGPIFPQVKWGVLIPGFCFESSAAAQQSICTYLWGYPPASSSPFSEDHSVLCTMLGTEG